MRRVELALDGDPVGCAFLRLRPDIAEALDLPDAMLSGFDAEVYLPAAAGGRREMRIAGRVVGSDGATWSLPELSVPADLDTLATDPLLAGTATSPGLDAEAGAEDVDRELLRSRLGYDPWHRVVLVECPAAQDSAGPAVAALDVIAERCPSLELLIAGVDPESVLADLLRRAIVATGLTDRVTVPRGEEPLSVWRAIADARIDESTAHDLGATIESLAAAARAEPSA